MQTSKSQRHAGNASDRGAKRRKSVAVAASMTVGAIFGQSAHAGKNIQVQRVAAGSAKINQQGLNTTIVASNRTIIDYTRFDVARTESVQFILPTIHSSILNRINSADPSHIDGHVIGNGNIYFANPSGVVFGPHAVLNVGQLYAAAGHMSDHDFLSGANHFTVGNGSVVNEGKIQADAVTLVGRQVINRGIIVGQQTVTMASGDDVYVGDRGANLIVKVNPPVVNGVPQNNSAGPAMPLGAGDIYSLAITNTGVIKGPGINVQAARGTASVSGHLDASSKAGKGGNIAITAPNVSVTGATVDASGKTGGGTVLVGDDAHGQGALPNANQTSIDSASSLKADATQNGAGGKVAVWSDQSTEFHGSISAKGGPQGGDGGWVETSGHHLDITGGKVDASAPKGKAGNWLLDPAEVDIDDNGGSNSSNLVSTNGIFAPNDNNASVFDVGVLRDTLAAGTSVTIATSNDGSGSNDINFLKPLSIDTSTATGSPTLTLQATNNISIGKDITVSGAFGVNLELQAGHDVTVSGNITTNNGFFHSGTFGTTPIVNGGTFSNTGTINAGSGAVQIHHAGNISLDADITAGTLSVSSASGNLSAAAVNLHADVQSFGVESAGHSVDLTTTPPSFASRDGSATPSNFSLIQADSIADASLPAAAQFQGSKTPGQYTIQSTAGSVTLSDNTKVADSALTLVGQGITLPAALTLPSLSATATGTGTAVTWAGVGPNQVTTTGSQAYAGQVTLTGDTTFTSTGGQAISFANAVDGHFTLTTDTAGLTTFGGPVGSGSALAGLTVNTGAAEVDGGLVHADTQNYKGSVTLGGTNPVAFTGTGAISFGTLGSTTDRVDGNAADVTVTTAGPIAFNIPVNTLHSLTAAGGGTTTISGKTVTTVENQTFGLVALGDDTIFSGAVPTFTTVDAANHNVTLSFSGALAIGTGFTNVNGLTVGAGTGSTSLAGTITTAGPQVYNDPVTLTNTTALVSTGDGAITFNKTVTGAAFPLTLTTNGLKTFGGDVTLSALNSNGGLLPGANQGAQTIGSGPITINAASQTYLAGLKLTNTGSATLIATTLNPDTGIDGGGTHDLTVNLGAGTLAVDSALFKNLHDFNATAGTINLVGNFTTAGSQTYTGSTVVVANSSLQTTGSGAGITFNSPIAGLANLGVSTSVATFNGNVAVGDLAVTSPSTAVNAVSVIATPGGVSFSGAVTVSQPGVTFSGATVGFGGTLTDGGASDVAVTGATSFGASVNLKSLAVTGSAIHLNGGTVTTSGDQTYTGPVSLGVNTQLQGSTLSAGSIDGGAGLFRNLTLIFSGNTSVSSNLTNIGNLTVGTSPSIPTAQTLLLAGSVSTQGFQTYNDKISLQGDVTLTSNGNQDITFSNTIDGNHGLVINTGGTTKFGAAVNIGALTTNGPGTTVITGQPIATTGAQIYNNPVQLGATTHLSGGTLSFGAGGSIDGTSAHHDLTLTFGGTTTLNGTVLKNLGTLTVGPTAGANTQINGSLTTQGNQTYNDPVTLAASPTLASGATITFNSTVGGTSLTTSAADAVFNGAVNLGSLSVGGSADVNTPAVQTTGDQNYAGDVAVNGPANAFTSIAGHVAFGATSTNKLSGPSDVTVFAPLATTFNGTADVKSLTTDAPGTTHINGGSIKTANTQDYGDDVALSANAVLTSTNDQGITFEKTLTGSGFSLTTVTAGTTTFRGAVNLGSLDVSTGTSGVDGGGVQTANSQTFAKDVSLGGLTNPITFASTGNGNITFNGALTGPAFDVAINTGGLGAFNGAVSVHKLTTDNAGPTDKGTLIAGGLVQTAGGGQTYNDPVALKDPATPPGAVSTLKDTASGNLTFISTLDGASSGTADLVTDTLGVTTFNKPVGGNAALTSLAVNTGPLTINGGLVKTTGDQTYTTNVTLNTPLPGVNPSLFQSTQAGTIRFDGQLAGPATASDVQFNARNTATGDLGTIIFKQPLSLESVNVLAGVTQVEGGGITTINDQTYADEVKVGTVNPVNFASTGAGNISFNGALSQLGATNADVTVNTAGTTTFAKAVTLHSLATDAPGTTTIAGNPITTTGGGQAFHDPVTVQGQVASKDTGAGTILFDSTINGVPTNSDLTIDTHSGATKGQVILRGAANLGSIAVTAGHTEIDGGSITTAGTAAPLKAGGDPVGQSYADDVTVNPLTPTTFKDTNTGEIAFFSTLSSGPAPLTVDTASKATFGGAVTAGSLNIANAAGSAEIDGGAITTLGTQTYHGAVALNNPAPESAALTAHNPVRLTSTGGSDIVFFKTLNGQASNSDVILSTAGRSIFGGAVSVGSVNVAVGATEIDGGSVASAGTGSPSPIPGGTGNVGQYYRGDVTLNAGSFGLATNSIVQLTDSNAGQVTFHQALSGPAAGSDVTIGTTGLTTFGGAVNVGALKVNVGPTEIDGGSVTTARDGGSGTVGQFYKGDVTLNGTHAIDPSIADHNPVQLADTDGGTITFGSQLTGTTSDLTLATSALTTFGHTVNLGSLKVSIGPTEIDSGTINTAGTGAPISGGFGNLGQYYRGDVTVNGPHTGDPTITDHNPLALNDSGSGTITFHSKLTGSPTNSDVSITTGGLTTFGDAVSLGSLKVLQGKTEIDGGSVATVGTGSPLSGTSAGTGQFYSDDVTLNGPHLSDPSLSSHNPVSLSDSNAGTVTFRQLLSGPTGNSDLSIATGGLTTFGGAVAVSSLKVTDGATEIDGGSITTVGTGSALVAGHSNVGQFYHGEVSLNSGSYGFPINDPVTLRDSAGGAIVFHQSLSGPNSARQTNANLTLDTVGRTTLGGTVTLGSLNIKTGPTEIDGGAVATAGTGPGRLGQNYAGVVAVNGTSPDDPSLTPHLNVNLTDVNAGSITFRNNVTDPTNSSLVRIDTKDPGSNPGQITFLGTVGVGSLRVTAGNTEIDGGSVVTNATAPALPGGADKVGQSYAGKVVLNAQRSAGGTLLAATTFQDTSSGEIVFFSTLSDPGVPPVLRTAVTADTRSKLTFEGAVSVGSLLVRNDLGSTEIDSGSVTTSGDQIYRGAVALNNPAPEDPRLASHDPVKLTSTGGGVVAFFRQLSGPAGNSDLEVATTGNTVFGGTASLGSVKIVAGPAEIDGGSITTAGTGLSTPAPGGVGSVGQYYFGDVTLNGTRLGDPAISTHNPVQLSDTGSGQITFRQTLTGAPTDSDLTVATAGMTTFGGAVSIGSLKVSVGPAEIDGGSITTAGTVSSSPIPGGSGAIGQYYHGDVTINGTHAIDPSITDHNPVLLSDSGPGTITFAGQVNGPASNSDLNIATSALTTFGQAVHLGSLKVLVGNTEIDGGAIATAGTGTPIPGGSGNVGQYYHGDVALNGPHAVDPGISDHNPVQLTDTGSGTVTFRQKLNGPAGNSDLLVTTGGLTTFGGAAGLGSLKIMDGPAEIDGGSVATAGAGSPIAGGVGNLGQYYHGDVAVNGPHASDPSIGSSNPAQLTDSGSGTITFRQTLSGPFGNSDLTVGSAGLSTFGGAVSLGSLKVSVGPAEIDGGSITTAGAGSASPIPGGAGAVGQYFHGDVMLNGPHASDPSITLHDPIQLTDTGAGQITFRQKLDGAAGAANLTVSSAGLTTFGGAVDITSLNVAVGPTEVDGGLVKTAGSQTYAANQEVRVNGPHAIDPSITTNNPVVFTDTVAGPITFGGSLVGVQGNSDVTVDTRNGAAHGNVTFRGIVGVSSLTVAAGHAEIDGGLVTTNGTAPALRPGGDKVGQFYADDVMLNAQAPAGGSTPLTSTTFTDTNHGQIVFLSTLHDPGLAHQTDVTLDATSKTTFGGAVDVGTLLVNSGPAEIDGGSITTAGFQQFMKDVALNNPSPEDARLLPHNPVHLTSLDSGDIVFHQKLSGPSTDSDLLITTAGTSIFGGAVNLGSLTVTAGPSEIDGGSITTAGTGSPIPGGIGNLGQYYHGDVRLNDGSDGLASNNPVALSDTGSGTVTFAGQLVNGHFGNSDLSITSDGLATFGKAVNLGSLKVLQGKAEIDGGSVTTAGTGSSIAPFPGNVGQFYANDVTLNGPHTSDPGIGSNNPVHLADTGSGTISFVGQLTGPGSDLTVTTVGLTSFQKQVTLGSLTTDGGGVSAINGGSVITATFQLYNDAVTLGAPRTILTAGSDVSFLSTVNGASDLTVLAPGVTRFNDTVNVNSLTTDAPGHTAIDGGAITTAAQQFYGDPVLLGEFKPAPVTLLKAGGSVTFSQTLDGASNLTITSGALATFGGAVGAATPLSSLTADGLAEIDGGSVKTTGLQLYNKDVALNGPHSNDPTIHSHNPVSFLANSTITFVGQLTGPSTNSDVSLSTPALSTFGGAVNVGSIKVLQGPAEIDGGSVTTNGTGSGIAPLPGRVGQFYAFDLTLNGPHAGSPAIGSHNPVTLKDNSTGTITFAGALNGPPSRSDLTVTTAGLTSFLKPVNIGSLVTDGGGVTAINGGTLTTAGIQTYKDDVTIGVDDKLASTGAGAITFNSTVTGPHGLTVNTAGATTFQKPVTVASLTTDAPGATAINGGAITTSGTQTYGDPVTLGAARTTLTGGGNITFAKTLGGNSDLLVLNPATTFFDGAVNLHSLTSDAAGTTAINGGAVTTAQVQHFGDDVTLGAARTQVTAGGAVTFDHSVTGNSQLTVTAGSPTTFNGPLNIATLTVNGGGITNLNGSTVTTSGAQSYVDDVVLGSNDVLSSTGGQGVTFSGTVAGPRALTVNTAGQTTFAKTIDIGSLTTDAPGTTVLQGGSIRTAADQKFGDPVTFTTGTTFTSTGRGDITFGQSLAGAPFDLFVNTAGKGTFVGPVTVRTLTTDAPGSTEVHNNITSAFDINFGDATSVVDRSVIQTAGAPITFHSSAAFSGPSAAVFTFGKKLEFDGRVKFAASQLTLSTRKNPAGGSGNTGARDIATTTTDTTGDGTGDIVFGDVVDASSGNAAVQTDHGNVTFNKDVTGGGTAVTVTTNGTTPPVNADTANDASVTFNGNTNVQNLDVNARNITVHNITAAQDITLQPHAQLSQIAQDPRTKQTGFGPFLPSPDQEPTQPDGLLVILPSPTTSGTQGPVGATIQAGGNLKLAPDTRGIIPSVATIWDRQPTSTGSQNGQAKTSPETITLSAGKDVVMGPTEKLTALGTINVSAGNDAVLSDMSAFTNLSVTARHQIVLQDRTSSSLLNDQGKLSQKDHGLDFFAGHNIVFNAPVLKAYTVKNGKSVLHEATPADVRFGVQDGLVAGSAGIGSFLWQHNPGKRLTEDHFLFQTTGLGVPTPNAVVLDASPLGPSATTSLGDNLVAPSNDTGPAETADTALDPATKKDLERMGIYVRDVTTGEKLERLSRHLVYRDVPARRPGEPPTKQEMVTLATDRLNAQVTRDVLKYNTRIYDVPAGQANAAQIILEQQKKVREGLVAAWKQYTELHPNGKFDAREFRLLLESGKYGEVRTRIDRIRNLGEWVEVMGLTPLAVQNCREALVGSIMPDDESFDPTLDDLKAAVFAHTPAAPTNDDAIPAIYLLKGRVDAGEIHVGGGSN